MFYMLKCETTTARAEESLEKIKESSNQEKMMRRICQKLKVVVEISQYIKSVCAIPTSCEEESKRCGSEEK